MTTYYLNGTPLVEGAEIELNGFSYPYSWLESTTPAVRASHGIEKVGDVNYDPKYYWNPGAPKDLEDREEKDEDGNQLYVKVWDATSQSMVDTTEKLVNFGLKTTSVTQIKNQTNELLSKTDFYIIRNVVENLEIPAEVSAYRAAVVAESTRLQEAIPSVENAEELIEVMSSVNWPKAL